VPQASYKYTPSTVHVRLTSSLRAVPLVRGVSSRLVVYARFLPFSQPHTTKPLKLPKRPKALPKRTQATCQVTFGVSFSSQPCSNALANCIRRALPAKAPFRNGPASEMLHLAQRPKTGTRNPATQFDLRGVLHQRSTNQGYTRSAGLSDSLPRAALMTGRDTTEVVKDMTQT